MVLVEVEPVLVLLVLLCFFDFFVLFIELVSVLPVEVFCAKTTVPESSERPRAAIMIFFIFEISPNFFVIALSCSQKVSWQTDSEVVLKGRLNSF